MLLLPKDEKMKSKNIVKIKNYGWDFGAIENPVCVRLECMTAQAMYKNQKMSDGSKRKFNTYKHMLNDVMSGSFFGYSQIEMEEMFLSNHYHYNT